ncbi:MAG: GNAT family N-acetyltransferase [Cytophagales bacterium]|nr:MAG: GNAT family N-acetyltransferase [Cytophagales bacterium]
MENDTRILVKKIALKQDQEKAFAIRQKVFVEEQQVPAEEEYDEYEQISTHFLATDEAENPCGTARWRITEKGIKLERFAVLAPYRGKGVGTALVKKVLEDIAEQTKQAPTLLYLHAQIQAMPLYQKFGFQPIGDKFEECNIEHFKMIKQV